MSKGKKGEVATTLEAAHDQLGSDGPINIKLNSGTISRVNSGGETANSPHPTGEIIDTSRSSSLPIPPSLESKLTELFGGFVEVSPEDKASYLRAVTYDVRFTAPASLLGGVVKCDIQNMSSDEEIWLQIKLGAPDAANALAAQRVVRCYTLASQIKQYTTPGTSEVWEGMEALEEVELRYQYWLKKDSTNPAITRALYGAVQAFNLKYAVLVARSSDENFW